MSKVQYGKCPEISYTKVSDKMAYANSADPDLLLIRVYTFCHFTKYFKEKHYIKVKFRPKNNEIKHSKFKTFTVVNRHNNKFTRCDFGILTLFFFHYGEYFCDYKFANLHIMSLLIRVYFKRLFLKQF